VLLVAPLAALIAAIAAREPLLATFMGGAAQFLAQFFLLFLIAFGKVMEDSGSVETIARFMTGTLGTSCAHAVLWHHAIRRAWSWHHCGGDRVGLRALVARLRTGCRGTFDLRIVLS
jgi:hypothetical protein